ncbi:MAG: right-handed parallel beta-helix repeat-containing protein [Candidatus Heimdallarchaeaceae archaeon]
MRLFREVFIILILISVSVLFTFSSPTPFNFSSFSYIDHSPITIDSDDDFTLLNLTGTGTPQDPYIIANFSISGSYDWGIRITSTTKYFVIRDCIISSVKIGIYIGNVSKGTVLIENTLVIGSMFGIVINADSCKLVNNRVLDVFYEGITVFDSVNVTLSNNLVNNTETGIRLISATNVEISNNTISNNLIGNQNRLSLYVSYHYNLFINNTQHAIILEAGSNHSIITYNDFIDNNLDSISQAYDDGYNNSWYDKESLEGNYWSNWIGKEFYPIEGSAESKDNYPLYYPVSSNIEQKPIRATSLKTFIPLLILCGVSLKRRRHKRKSN